MKRRKFVEYAALTTASTQLGPLLKIGDQTLIYEHEVINCLDHFSNSKAPESLNLEFQQSLRWLKENGWLDFLDSILGYKNFESLDSLEVKFTDTTLQKILKTPGFEDFAGIKMIEPGRPSMSLLYHAVASPRVRPYLNKEYFLPEQYAPLAIIDSIENYIYSLESPNFSLDSLPEDYVLAVFAYEYRPGYKTPDGTPYADHVYSRTGIARIGECPYVYDRVMRSFSNKPDNEKDNRKAAVTPARYGLFIAKVVKCNEVNLYSEEHDDRTWFRSRRFLQPIRKIFNGDSFIDGRDVRFYESHHNEQLSRLANFQGVSVEGDFKRSPFLKKGPDLVTLKMEGSSALLIPTPAPLVSIAEQDGKIISMKVEKETGKGLTSDRRYTSMKLLEQKKDDVVDFVRTEGIFPKYKATRFSAPRNAPMFINIRNKVSDDRKSYTNLGPQTEGFENLIIGGGYRTAVFEDNICEGCVTANLEGYKGNATVTIFPAFSLATAPDFFPLTDSYDYEAFDKGSDSSFLAGGIENLSYCRLGPNPAIQNPVTGISAFPNRKTNGDTQYEQKSKEVLPGIDNIDYNVSDTLLAIISSYGGKTNKNYEGKKEYKDTYKRDYKSTSFLTDTSAFVFAPGWEATYSGTKGDVYLATFGLGSPFPEDMKLCAAANGMWPVASPDAARTFQGSLLPFPTPKLPLRLTDQTVPPTAIPLMDEEIGICKGHPGLKDLNCVIKESYGWDGEQGPYLELINDVYKVNFTDIGRADYVNNLIDKNGPGFNLSLLRELDCHELISRVECLRRCKLQVEGTRNRYSKLWLVSAEKVLSWENGAKAIGVPVNLVGKDKDWVKIAQPTIEGSGYLYIFVKPKYESRPEFYQWVAKDSKRRYLDFDQIIVCQVTTKQLKYCSIPPTGLQDPHAINWLS